MRQNIDPGGSYSHLCLYLVPLDALWRTSVPGVSIRNDLWCLENGLRIKWDWSQVSVNSKKRCMLEAHGYHRFSVNIPSSNELPPGAGSGDDAGAESPLPSPAVICIGASVFSLWCCNDPSNVPCFPVPNRSLSMIAVDAVGSPGRMCYHHHLTREPTGVICPRSRKSWGHTGAKPGPDFSLSPLLHLKVLQSVPRTWASCQLQAALPHPAAPH